MDFHERESGQSARRLCAATSALPVTKIWAPVTQSRRHKERPVFHRPPPHLLLLALLCLTSCETLRHQFVQPTPNWQAKVGQLQYRGPRTSLIGEVLIRYSSTGDFELTFSKGPGVTLLTVRQDDKFVRVSGPLARGSWSGPPNEAPSRLRGWISLRQLFLHGKAEPIVRQTVGRDSFTFAF